MNPETPTVALRSGQIDPQAADLAGLRFMTCGLHYRLPFATPKRSPSHSSDQDQERPQGVQGFGLQSTRASITYQQDPLRVTTGLSGVSGYGSTGTQGLSMTKKFFQTHLHEATAFPKP